MIVRTTNSVYRVEEREGSPRFSVEKIEDKWPGGHPNVHVGEVRYGNELHVKVGENMVLSERTDGRSMFVTTRVISVARPS